MTDSSSTSSSQTASDMTRLLENVKVKVNELLEKVPPVNEQLSKLSKKFNIDKAYIVLGVVGALFFMLLFFSSGDVAVDLFGFLYPVYASIKAIETEEKEDDTFWLTYWLVFALFKVVENIADIFISSIPFYFLIKIAFLYWCFSSQFKGSKHIYEGIIKPFIVPHILSLEEKKESEGKKSD